MCAGAILNARLGKVVWGAPEPKTGAAGSVIDVFALPALNHQTENQGHVLAEQCSQPLQTFFKHQRLAHKAKAAQTRLRDDAVRNALMQQGVPSQRVTVGWVGETEPPVATADGVREPRNRLVEIYYTDVRPGPMSSR